MVLGKKRGAASQEARTPGTDSEFYRVEHELANSGLARDAGETVMEWLVRINEKLPAGWRGSELREVAHLHYRYRFDPVGLSESERGRLRELSLACLNTGRS